MPKRLLPACSLLFATLLTACGAESPTGTAPSVQAAAAKQPGTCVFMTPNGKTHTSSAAKCPTPAPVAQIAGTYELTRFTFRQLEWVGDDRQLSELYDAADLLGEGGVVFELTLHPDGTTSGTFYAPPDPDESGSGLDADLAGTWRLDGGRVVIDTADESIIDLVSYSYVDGRLTAGPATVGDADDPMYIEEVILTRQ